MKAIRYSCILIFVCFVGVISSAQAAEQGQGKGKVLGTSIGNGHPDWWKSSFLDIAEDASEAWEEGKHLIIFFHLDGCPYCFKMAKENFTDSPYIDFLKENFAVVPMNTRGSLEVTMVSGEVMTEKELADRLDVRFTPGMMFFDGDGNQVLRMDGYRTNEQFEPILQFVASRSYKDTSLSDYLAERRQKQQTDYTFLDNPHFTKTADLSSLLDKPIMLLLEDKTCGASCSHFHKKFLAHPETQKLLAKISLVRWDALSDEPVRDHLGQRTTPRRFAAEQKIVYRPGIILIDRGKVLARRNSYAVLHHFLGGLEYIATRSYLTQGRREFSEERERRILDSGDNIDLRI